MPRWKTFEPGIETEEEARAGLIERIERWWESFDSKAGDLDAMFRGKEKFGVAAWMGQTLATIDGDLMWEFGPGPDQSPATTPSRRGSAPPSHTPRPRTSAWAPLVSSPCSTV